MQWKSEMVCLFGTRSLFLVCLSYIDACECILGLIVSAFVVSTPN
jgi:hypothetical protein